MTVVCDPFFSSLSILVIRPSAGDTTRFPSSGISLSGLRKKYAINRAKTKKGTATNHSLKISKTTNMARGIKTYGIPSLTTLSPNNVYNLMYLLKNRGATLSCRASVVSITRINFYTRMDA
jgi:hypothetical protein